MTFKFYQMSNGLFSFLQRLALLLINCYGIARLEGSPSFKTILSKSEKTEGLEGGTSFRKTLLVSTWFL